MRELTTDVPLADLVNKEDFGSVIRIDGEMQLSERELDLLFASVKRMNPVFERMNPVFEEHGYGELILGDLIGYALELMLNAEESTQKILALNPDL